MCEGIWMYVYVGVYGVWVYGRQMYSVCLCACVGAIGYVGVCIGVCLRYHGF